MPPYPLALACYACWLCFTSWNIFIDALGIHILEDNTLPPPRNPLYLILTPPWPKSWKKPCTPICKNIIGGLNIGIFIQKSPITSSPILCHIRYMPFSDHPSICQNFTIQNIVNVLICIRTLTQVFPSEHMCRVILAKFHLANILCYTVHVSYSMFLYCLGVRFDGTKVCHFNLDHNSLPLHALVLWCSDIPVEQCKCH